MASLRTTYRRRPAVGLAGLLCLLATTAVRAEDWPQFRGPAGQGCSQEKALPVHWDDHSGNIRWKTAIPGQGASSPIVSQGRVYLTTAYEGEQRHPLDTLFVVLALGLGPAAALVLLFRLWKSARWFFPKEPPEARQGRIVVAILAGLTFGAVVVSCV